jgi:hypothetical protein
MLINYCWYFSALLLYAFLEPAKLVHHWNYDSLCEVLGV